MSDFKLCDATLPFAPAALSRRAFVGAAAATAGACALPSSRAVWASDAPASEIVIFHTNDTHGYLEGDGVSCVGIDYVAGLHASVPNSLLFDAGDASQGAALASLSRGDYSFELMKTAGYDAMCLGNHEFDYGLDALLGHAASVPFPLLGANVFHRETGERLLEGVGACGNGGWTVLSCAGRRIGVFGVITSDTPGSTAPDCVADVVFGNELEAAEKCIAALVDEGVDAIVGLSHLGGVADVSCMAPDLLAMLDPELARHLTVLIDGHSHTVENELVNGVLMVQTGCNLSFVGKVTLTFAPDGSVSAAGELIDPETLVNAGVQPEPRTAAVLDDLVAQHADYLATPVGLNPVTLWGGSVGYDTIEVPTRVVQTNLGTHVCKALYEVAAAYLRSVGDESTPLVSLQNGGGIRARIPRGVATVGDCVTAYPFDNTIVLKPATPKLLYEVAEWSFMDAHGQDAATGLLLQEIVSGDFNQVYGARVTIDPNAPAGSRVVEIRLDGTEAPLDRADDATPLMLVSNSYVMSGGGHPGLGEIEGGVDLGAALDALIDYTRRLSEQNADGALPLYAGGTDVLAFCGGYEPAPWTAHVCLVDAHHTPLPNTRALVQVDAGDVVLATSDAEGLLAIELSDGPHALALVATGEGCEQAQPPALGEPCLETYVNNYIGTGLFCSETRPWPQLMLL